MGLFERLTYLGAGAFVSQDGGDDVPVETPFVTAGYELGSESFAVPTTGTVRYVSPSGSNGAAGTFAAPWQTFAYAWANAPTGSTVVLRTGDYLEGDFGSLGGRTLTFQPYLDEVVRLDGSRIVATGSWTSLGGNLYRCTYTAKAISASTTAGTNANRRLTDQLFIDDVRWSQIADSTTPTVNGTFSVNRGASTMTAYVTGGVSGKVCKVSDKTRVALVTSPLHLKGIGIQYFTPTEVTGGTSRQVLYYNNAATGSTIDRCHFRGTSAVFVEMTGAGSGELFDPAVTRCTFQEAGVSATQIGRTRNLRYQRNEISGTNLRGWAAQPEAGAAKFVSNDGADISHLDIRDFPNGMGLWGDVSNIRCAVYSNRLDATDAGRGQGEDPLNWEESDGGFVGGTQYRNRIVNNDCIGGYNYAALTLVSGYCDWWNNRLAGGGIGQINFQQDRINNPNTTLPSDIDRLQSIAPWDSRHNRFVNNDVGYSPTGGGNQITAVSTVGTNIPYYRLWDYFDLFAGNWLRPVGGSGQVVRAGKTPSGSSPLNTQAALASSGAEFGGPPTTYSASNPTGKLGPNHFSTTAPSAAVVASTAVPLPAEIAALMGLATGARFIGVNEAQLPIGIHA